MTTRTITRSAKSAFAPKVLEIEANLNQSKAKGIPLTIEELPRFLAEGGIKKLEETEYLNFPPTSLGAEV